MAEQPISVFVVDDDFYAREAISLYLSKDRRTRLWGSADSIGSAVDQLGTASSRTAPDLILLDVRFGSDERAGVDGIALVREAHPEVKVLMSSAERNEDRIVEAIAAGADGFVWKNESGEGIANAVSSVCEGRFVVTRSIADLLLGKAIELRSYSTEVMKGESRYADLTEALRKTIYLFCFAGMSKEEIAQELQVSPNTVASRVKTAYAILGAGSRGEAFQVLVEREA